MRTSKKHQAKLRHYNKVKAELEQELKDKGEWRCFFSDTPIPDHLTWKGIAWHHGKGRDGDLLTDRKFIRPVANEYHAMYHDKPTSFLKGQWWWGGFMKRLKELDEDLWYNHKLREEK